MAIEVIEISAEERKAVLRLSEDHFHDLKARDITPAKLTRSLSAFANASGGELYIGIDEESSRGEKRRGWRGFADAEDANGFIQAFEEFFPLSAEFSYEFLKARGAKGFVLHVSILKTREILRGSDGIAYVRRGAQNLPVKSAEAVVRLKYDKGIASYESQPIAVTPNVVLASPILLEYLTHIVPAATPKPWLQKQMLLNDGKPTVAAVLLFAEEPQAALPKRSAIKIYRYETKLDEGTRETLSFQPITIEGCLYKQIFEAVETTVKVIETIKVLGKAGLEQIAYPKETLHEIITNAVLHRDYSIAVDVHVRVFDNRIEVESPGRLPGHVTPENILREQLARNGTLVRLINKFEDAPNKDVGEGLNTAFAAMKKLRLKEPTIEERENSVVVRIRHEALASPEEAVIDFLKNHDEISNRIGRELTGIGSENAMKEVFYRLRDQGLIERTPGKASSASTWRKCEAKN